jgi:hypothetical protein
MTDINENYIEQNSKRKDLIPLNLFWLGFMIYAISYAVSSTDQVSYVFLNVLQVFGLLLLVPSAFFLCRLKIEDSFLSIVFLIYMFWSVTVILRGFRFDYDTIKQMLFNPVRGIFPYLVPIVLLFPKKVSFYKKVFSVIIILGIFFLIFCIFFINDLLYPHNYFLSQGIIETFAQQLSLSVGFILLTFIYHSKSRNLFSLFVMTVTFLFAAIRARRGLIFMSFSMLFFSFLIYQYANKTKVINMVLSVFLILMVSYVAVKVYENNRKDTFSLITRRIGVDTRTDVEHYFYKDFELKDWIVGRGINGQYFCPGVNDGERISIYRGVIETGFLQIILNGGVISLALFLLIAVPAIFKGLFYSKNLLSKAAGIWILLFFLYAYPGMPAIFSLNYLLVWFSIGICYSEEMRDLSDDEVKIIIRADKNHISQVEQI